MNESRKQIVLAVLQGSLPVDMITEEELIELEEAVMNAVAEKRNPYLPHFDYALQ